MPYELDELVKRVERAKQIRAPWESVWQECYDFGIPGRKGFMTRSIDTTAFDKLFDTTAADSLSTFANTLQTALCPPMAVNFELYPAFEQDAVKKQAIKLELDPLRDRILQGFEDSDVEIADPETFLDTGCVGGGFQLMVELPGQWPPWKLVPVPSPDVWLLPGPYGQPDGWARCNSDTLEHLQQEYPDAVWPQAIVKRATTTDKDKLVLEVWETVSRDWDEIVPRWSYCIYTEGPTKLFEGYFNGPGSCPWLTARWTGAAQDFYGRPPMLMALPLAKTLNLADEMTLENAELALSGMWQYEGGDVINPNTIRLVPGSIIPKVPGTAGLEPLQVPGRFDVSQMLYVDKRAQVRAIFYDVDLGPMDKTPMSAQEAQIRVQKALQRMGTSYLRLRSEFVEMRVIRALHLLIKNQFVPAPNIPLDQIRVRVISPLQRAVSMESVERISGYMGVTASLFGPQLATMMVDPVMIAAQLADHFQIDAKLRPSPEKMQAMMEKLGGAIGAAEQQQPGVTQPLIEAATEILPKG